MRYGGSMDNWYQHLKKGLSRKPAEDRLADQDRTGGIRADLKNLHPYLVRHWRKAVLGVHVILAASLLGFPQPLITRYIVDDVILGRNLGLLAGAIFLLVGVAVAQKGMSAVETFFFERFEQRVTLDIQQDLVDRVLHFPKAFFDRNQTGYLMSRLSPDVERLRWFFSSTAVYVVSNGVRCLGGLCLLFYLQWRLALIVLLFIPGMVLSIRYFSTRVHLLSHHSMEQDARVSGRLEESLSSTSLIKAFASEARTVARIMAELKKAFRISLERTAVSSLANLATDALPGLARMVVLALGAYWVIEDQWTLGSLLAFQAYLGYVFGPARFLASANLELQEALAALQRVSALFDIVPE